jgi:hypothetical protein
MNTASAMGVDPMYRRGETTSNDASGFERRHEALLHGFAISEALVLSTARAAGVARVAARIDRALRIQYH